MDLLKTLVLLVLTSILVQTQVLSQNFSYEIDSTTAIGCIGHFNADSVPDTLFYKNISNTKRFPTCIAWGKNDSITPPIPRTIFQYPYWTNVKSTFHTLDFNNDSKMDIIFILRHERPETSNTNNPIIEYYPLFVAIMGGYGIDTVPIVDFARLPSSDKDSFYCVKLKKGVHFQSDYAKLSPGKSIPSKRLIPMKPTSSGGTQQRIAANTEKSAEKDVNESFTVNVFPNPVTSAANVAFNNIEAGDYTIRVTDMKGDVYKTVAQRFDSSGDIVRRIDLDELPDGVYFITVSSAGSTIGMYKIVILH